MRAELSDTQRELRETVRAFATQRIGSVAAETDRAARLPRDLVAALADLGVLGCCVPERYGGAGFDQVAQALVVEELAAACASTAAIVRTHALACWSVVAFGSESQRAHYLPPLARGEYVGCVALSEAPTLAARRGATGWVLNGTARFVTNAPEAGVAIVGASLGAAGGVAAFVVETASPGWAVTRRDETTGERGAQAAEVALTDLRVAGEGRLDEDGATIVRRALDAARIGLAAEAVGIARASFTAALAYAQERRVFGQAIAEFQGAQWRLADMATAVEAARLLTLRAASLMDRGLPYTREAAMAKLHAAETAMTLATQAVQMHGGYGYTREFPVERHFRNATVIATDEPATVLQHLITSDLTPTSPHAE